MKSSKTNSRRNFIGTLALGTAAGTLPLFANSLNDQISGLSNNTILHDAEEWFKKVKGTHRIAYDGSTPHNGFPVIWTWAFYLTNNETGVKDEDMTAVCVLRHSGIPFAFKNSLWEKYKLGEMFGVNDNKTGAASLRNLYYEPQEGDFPLPGIQGIKEMQARGAMFCVCDLAMKVYSSMAAQKMNMKPEDAYAEWKAAVMPGIQMVPSGVWALGRAQEHGCGYIFAGG